MRWDELFADIEGQLEQELDAERLDLEAEEERLRLGRLALRERLLAMSRGGAAVRLALVDGDALELRIDEAGRDWIAGETGVGETVVNGAGRTIVVPLTAVAAAFPGSDQLESGLRPAPAEPGSALAGRLGLAFVLRELCRRRVAVELRTMLGTHHGTIDRVGRDHLDLAEHDAGEPRRERLVRRIRIVPFAAILRVRA